MGPLSTSKPRAIKAFDIKLQRLQEAKAQAARPISQPIAAVLFERLNGPWKRELAPSTMELYVDTVYERYVKEDPIGDMLVEEVTQEDLEEYRERLFAGRKGKPISPYSVERYEACVHRLLREKGNPAPNQLNPLKKPRHNVHWLAREDREEFLNALWPYPERVAAALFMHGIGIAEACGLSPSAYNGKTLKIEKQDQEIRGKRREGTGLKRPRRYRTVPLAPWLVEMLDKVPKSQPRILLAPEGGYLLPNNLRRSFRELLKDTKYVQIGPHDLRRSAGKWMLDSGAKLNDVAGILGNDVRVLLIHYDTKDADGMRSAIEKL